MAKVFIDNKEYEVPNGKNMLEVCLSLGMDLTYFCWHPAMHSVGACRQCAVTQYRDENDTRGKLTMACMLDANEGTRISILDQKSKDFRAGNIEALMINHPHDCPVCDEGGECHLQDMTVMSGHNYRRYRFKKRTHLNQDLGPFIKHEMNRCIQCYRCVRFYNDYAGGKDFGVFASSGRVYFGRSESGTLESEFSGNLVEVCPTGVFTDKTLHKHYTRKWDLTSAPSVCHQCSVGCNTLASERYGGLRRIMTRYNGDVNGYFLCDRGRFGYEYVNDEKRLTRAAQKENTSGPEAFASVRKHLASSPKMIGIGSPRASLESNFMLKQLVGAENFYQGIPGTEAGAVNTVLEVLQNGKVKTPSLKEIESYDTIFILGEDLTNAAPRIALSLRQAAKNLPREKAYALRIQTWNDAAIREVVQGETGPFFVATPYATKLEDIATSSFHGDTSSLVSLGKKIAAHIRKGEQGLANHDEETGFASATAKALSSSQKPLIVSGTGMMSKAIIRVAASIAGALKEAGKEPGLVFAVPEANSMGLSMMGAAGALEEAADRVAKENDITAVVLETDLFYRTDKNTATGFLNRCQKTILLDTLENQTTPEVDFILPAGTFAESDGTLVNNEGRAQRYYQVFQPKNEMKSSWAWLDMMIHNTEDARPFDAIVSEMAEHIPAFDKIKTLAPAADYRIGTQRIPRQTHRFSGRTSINANVSVHEPKPPVDKDSPLSYTMEGYQGQPPSADIPYYWSPGWNSIQSINKYQIEVGGELHGGNPGIRLIEPQEDGATVFEENIVSAGKGRFEILPAWDIFGSGEMSALSPAVAKRIPEAAVSVSEKALQGSGLSGAEKIRINYHSGDIVLPVKVDNSLPDNVLLFPKGFKETAGMQFPLYGDIAGV
ncbi:MAG: NADH-quinone oxidoreductase subunit NuoG [Chitinophagaceae bacterium]|nr:NADH-quinone oxidoreductase subunit NuoG [Chitinophagaceae bacterium]